MLISFKEIFSMFLLNRLLVFIVVCFVFLGCNKRETAYYSSPKIVEYHIICNTDSLNYIYTNYTDNTYIPIKIVIKGDSSKAKMRIRGDSSRKDAKKSLKIKFYKNFKKHTLNLNAEFSDKSFVRQYLSSQIMRASGQNCFESKFTKLYINGKYFGLYLQVENMDEGFLRKNLLEENGNLYKATKDGACLSIFETVEEKWEQKNGAQQNFDDLKTLIAELNTVSNKDYFAFVQEKFNYADFLNMLALNIYLANGSTYYHNYYLYHHPKGKWELLPWDMDKSLSYYDWLPYQYHRTSSNWESDNPLIEKAFLNTKIMGDIRNRLAELSKTSASKKSVIPLINKLEILLEDAVKNDSTDQIKNLKEWKDFLKKEKRFFKNRHKKLQEQIDSWPSTFVVKRIEQKVCNEVFFGWNSSKSNKGKDITYILSVSADFLFEDSTKLITKTTSDTSFLFTEKLPNGKYYWKITATDGEFFVDGFNSKNIFEKVSCSQLPNLISENTFLKKNNSPYLLNQTLTVEKGVNLTIEKGVEIRMDTGVNILVHGTLLSEGTKENPIVFCPMKKVKEWGYFYFFHTTAKFDYTKILEGKINSKYTDLSIKNSLINIKKKRLVFGVNRNPIIWTHHGSFLLENSVIDGKGTGEGINTNFSKSIVKNSTFINLPDAIEFICVNDGLIENCVIKNSPDDAIDMNACHNILVRNNVIFNTSDKGISVGKEQYGHSSNILIEGNQILQNNIGIAVKDSSFAEIKNNLFYSNKTAISLYQKDTSTIGGIATITSNVFYKNSSAFSIDALSKPTVLTNISDGILPKGKTKVSENLADSIYLKIDF